MLVMAVAVALSVVLATRDAAMPDDDDVFMIMAVDDGGLINACVVAAATAAAAAAAAAVAATLARAVKRTIVLQCLESDRSWLGQAVRPLAEMTEEEREQQWSPLTSESENDDNPSPPPTPRTNPTLTDEEMRQYSNGHPMVIRGPSIDVSANPTYCTYDSDGNFVDDDSSEEEEETVQVATPRSIRAARRSAMPIALMFLITMAVPGDAAILQNGTVLFLQPAQYGSVLTGAEWTQLIRDFHTDFYYYRSAHYLKIQPRLKRFKINFFHPVTGFSQLTDV